MSARFPASEYQARLARVQKDMEAHGLAALLLTTEADVRYLTGFLTRFWESPTRPWFLIVPASGQPISVIPAIGADLMRKTWIEDIRTWRSPNYADDGLSLLSKTLAEVAIGGPVGVPMEGGTHLRMPLSDWMSLTAHVPCSSDLGVMRRARMVKSAAEIEVIRDACAIAGRAFSRIGEIAGEGVPLSEVFRRFQMLCLEEGADHVPYIAGAAGCGGYGDVISPATSEPLKKSDVLMLDTGLTLDGYFCDYDRNFSIGPPDPHVADAHVRLIEATRAAFAVAQPGRTAADLFHAMDAALGGAGEDAGRLGHGLGMQLTEPPSLISADTTELSPGMVLTLEPGIMLPDGKLMVHEEDIVITERGADWLTSPAKEKITVI